VGRNPPRNEAAQGEGEVSRRLARATRLGSRMRIAASSLLHTVLRGQTGFTMGLNLLLMGTSLLSGSLAAHLLGPTGRGQLAAIQLWPLAIMTIGSGGIVEAVSYYSGRFRQQSGVFGITATVMLAVLAIPLVLIGIVAMPHLLAAEPRRIVIESRVYMFIVPVLFFINIPLAVLRGRGDMRMWNMLRLTQPVGYVVILLVAAFLPVDRVTFVAFAMFGWLATHVLVSLALLRWYLPGPHRFDGEQVGPMVRYGALSISSTTPSWLNGRMDQLVMGAFLSPHLLGLYAVAVAWSLAVTPVSNAFGQVILPRLAGAHDRDDAAERLCATSRIASGTNALIGVGFLLISPLAVYVVFGASFAPAIPATMVLVVAAVCLGMNQFLEEAVRGLGRPGLATVAELCGFVVTAVGLALLLPRFGILGAALASLLSYATVLIMLVVILHRRLGLRPRDLLLPRPAEVRSLLDRFRPARTRPARG